MKDDLMKQCVWRYKGDKDFTKGYVSEPKNGFVCIERGPLMEHNNFYLVEEIEYFTHADMP